MKNDDGLITTAQILGFEVKALRGNLSMAARSLAQDLVEFAERCELPTKLPTPINAAAFFDLAEQRGKLLGLESTLRAIAVPEDDTQQATKFGLGARVITRLHDARDEGRDGATGVVIAKTSSHSYSACNARWSSGI